MTGSPQLSEAPHTSTRTEADALRCRMKDAAIYAKCALDIGPRMAMVERSDFYERQFRAIRTILEGK